jgi:hypothetical protein
MKITKNRTFELMFLATYVKFKSKKLKNRIKFSYLV